jgi:hypothetical protein
MWGSIATEATPNTFIEGCEIGAMGDRAAKRFDERLHLELGQSVSHHSRFRPNETPWSRRRLEVELQPGVSV